MSDPSPLSALPDALHGLLGEDLEVTLTTRLRRTDQQADDAPDVRFHSARIAWRYYLGNDPLGETSGPEEEDDVVTAWAATHGAAPDGDGQIVVEFGRAEMATISRFGRRPFDQLDSISGGYAALGEVLFEGVDGHGPFNDVIEGGAGLALLLDDIEVHEPFRGYGVGVAAVDLLLTYFDESCACAALEAVDPAADGDDDDDDDEQATARHGLARYWSTLGFATYAGDVMTIDLGKVRPFHPGGGLRSV